MTAARPRVRYNALVLAAQRGVEDPLAGLSPKGHKCLLPIAGRPMIERVVAALIAAQEVGEIAISIDRREVLEEVPGFAELIAAKRLRVVQSAATPATSVLEGVAALDIAQRSPLDSAPQNPAPQSLLHAGAASRSSNSCMVLERVRWHCTEKSGHKSECGL